MGTITSQTNDNRNFSQKELIDNEELEIPERQEMVISKSFRSSAEANLIIYANSSLTILGDKK